MTISFSGLASGLDTSSWVESLVALKQAKVTTLQEEKEKVLISKDTLNSIRSFFSSFRSTIERITDSKFNIVTMDLFAQNLATSANLNVLTATATTEAEEATYNIKVDKLATNTNATSTYNYLTTIIETTTATTDSLLKNIGVTAGDIGVTVNGIKYGITITESETIATFIDKLKEIGVDASYNEVTGVFSANLNESDIDDIDNTGIADKLHLEGVNEGYKTLDRLEIKNEQTVWTPADNNTLLKDLGVNAGTITIEANGIAYDITIDNATTLGEFVSALQTEGIDANLDLDTGIFTLIDAEITNEGSTNILDAMGLHTDIYSKSQRTEALTHETIVTQTTTATAATLLKDIGEGTAISDGQTVIVKNSNNEYKTISVGTGTSIGQLLAEISNAGLYAAIDSNGVIEISGGTITGGSFDAISALGLETEPYTAMVTGDSLTETIIEYELVTYDTRLVDDLGVSEGYLRVTDPDGNHFYQKIYSGQTIGDLMADLANNGIYSTLDEDNGILEITGGAFETLTDADVQHLVNNLTIAETDARYIKGTNLLECLYGAGTIATDQITVASAYSRTRALTQHVTYVVDATLSTTLGTLGLSGNGTAIFDARGESKTINVTTSMTIQGLMDALAAQGIESSWDSDYARITINNSTLTGGSSNLDDVLNLTTEIDGKYVTSNNLYSETTVTVDATRDTTFAELGVNSNQSIVLKKEDGTDYTFAISGTTSMGSFIDTLNSNGVTAKIEDGVFSIDGGYIVNDAVVEALGLVHATFGFSEILGNRITHTIITTATGDSTVGDIITALGTGSEVASGYNMYFNSTALSVSATTTMDEILTQIYDLGGTSYLDTAGRLHIDNGTLSGTVANALGFSSVSTTDSVSATGEILTTITTLHADTTTKLKELGLGLSTIAIKGTDGVDLGTITTSADMTIGDLFTALAGYGISGTINNGVVTLQSDVGAYATGGVLTSMGVGTSTTTYTTTAGTTNTSTAVVSVTYSITADSSTTLGSLGLGASTISVNGVDGVAVGTITTNAAMTIGDVLTALAGYGISGTIKDGKIYLDSDIGNYATGGVLTSMGIGTSTTTYTTTTGTSATSSIAITYSTTTYSTTYPTITETVKSTHTIVTTGAVTGTETITVVDTVTDTVPIVGTKTLVVSHTVTTTQAVIGSQTITVSHTITTTEPVVGTQVMIKDSDVVCTEVIATTETIIISDSGAGTIIPGSSSSVIVDRVATLVVETVLATAVLVGYNSNYFNFFSRTTFGITFTDGTSTNLVLGSSLSSDTYISDVKTAFEKLGLSVAVNGATITLTGTDVTNVKSITYTGSGSDGTLLSQSTKTLTKSAAATTVLTSITFQGYSANYFNFNERSTFRINKTDGTTTYLTIGTSSSTSLSDLQGALQGLGLTATISGSVITATSSAALGIKEIIYMNGNQGGSYGSITSSSYNLTNNSYDISGCSIIATVTVAQVTTIGAYDLSFSPPYLGAPDTPIYYSMTVNGTFTEVASGIVTLQLVHTSASGQVSTMNILGTTYEELYNKLRSNSVNVSLTDDGHFVLLPNFTYRSQSYHIVDINVSAFGPWGCYPSIDAQSITFATKLGYVYGKSSTIGGAGTSGDGVYTLSHVCTEPVVGTTVIVQDVVIGGSTSSSVKTILQSATIMVNNGYNQTDLDDVIGCGFGPFTFVIEETNGLKTTQIMQSTATVEELITFLQGFGLNASLSTNYSGTTYGTLTVTSTSASNVLKISVSSTYSFCQLLGQSTQTITTASSSTSGQTVKVTMTVPKTTTTVVTHKTVFTVAQDGSFSATILVPRVETNVVTHKVSTTLTVEATSTTVKVHTILQTVTVEKTTTTVVTSNYTKSYTVENTTTGVVTHTVSMTFTVDTVYTTPVTQTITSTAVIQKTTYTITTTTSTATMSEASKFSQLSLAAAGTVTVNSAGTLYTVTVETTDTVGDLIASLAGLGIYGTINGGKITFSGDKEAFITAISSNVATALGLTTAGKYTTTGHTTTSNTTSNEQRYSVTNTLTSDDVFTRHGLTSAGTVTVVSGGKLYTVTVEITDTVDDLISSLAGLGIYGTINGGKITFSGDNEAYIKEISSNLNTLFKIGTTNYATTGHTTTSNTTSNEQKTTVTAAATGTTQLQYLRNPSGTAPSGYQLVLSTTSDAGNQLVTLAFSTTSTVYNVIDKLAEYGLQATIDNNGRFALYTSSLTDFDISGTLGSFIMGGTYTKLYDEGSVSSVSTNLVQRTIVTMDDGTVMSKLNITNGNILLYQDGNFVTLAIDNTKTIGDFRTMLANYGIVSNIIDGRLQLNADGVVYLKTPSGGSNALTILGIDYPNWNLGDFSQESKDLTDTQTIVHSATWDDKINELTDNAGNPLGVTAGQIYVYQDGTRNVLNIDTNDTLQTLANKLSQYGITMTLDTNGKLYFDGNNNSYLTTDGIASGSASNILTKFNILNNWETRYTSTSETLDYEVEDDIQADGSTKLSDLQDADGNNLGITEGSYYVYQNGVRSTETINGDTTLNDFRATMASYGLITDFNENGELQVGAYNESYLATADTGGANTNAISVLFEEWNFVNVYTSNNLEIPQDVIVSVTETTKLADINGHTYQPGFISVVKDGVKTDIELTADDTIGDLMDELSLYGFESVINANGQLIIKNTGDSLLQAYSGAGTASNALSILGVNLNDWITTNSYESGEVSVTTKTPQDISSTRDTLLSEMGVTTGEYYFWKDGVKHTAYISSDETLGSFIDTLQSFGIETSLVDTGVGSILSIEASGNCYIETSASETNASNVVDKLFTAPSGENYAYSGLQQTSAIVTTFSAATEDTLLSYYDEGLLISEGDLSVTVDGSTNVINITADETIGSLLGKFQALGMEATLNDGHIVVQSGYKEFTINADGTTSNMPATLNLAFQDDLGGYIASQGVVEQTTTTIEEKTLSVSNYAGVNTAMRLLNISDGTLTVYRDGEKATLNIDSNQSIGDLRAQLASRFGGDVDIRIENDILKDGYLEFYSKTGAAVEVGSTTDTSNFSAITGVISTENGAAKSARELYCVNNQSVITTSGLFRNGDVKAGTFYIGDAEFSITDTTQLSHIISQINASESANATAYWDSVDGKLVIKSRTTGAALVNIEAGTSNFTDIMGFTNSEWADADGDGDPDVGENLASVTKMNVKAQQVGENARFSINGTYYTSTSNTVGSDVSRIKGVTINLKGVSEEGETTLTIEKDKETVANAVSDIVDAYNELIENVDKEITKGGTLDDQFSLKLIRNQIRSLMTSSISGINVFKNLDAVGISLDKATAGNISTDTVNVLNFDKDKFLEAFDADRDSLKNLLVGTDTNLGVFRRIENVVEQALSGVYGYFASAEKSYNTEISRIDTKIKKANEAVIKYRERLEAKFASMDLLIANMQNQYSSFLG